VFTVDVRENKLSVVYDDYELAVFEDEDIGKMSLISGCNFGIAGGKIQIMTLEVFRM
jgi:hypothetical protein